MITITFTKATIALNNDTIHLTWNNGDEQTFTKEEVFKINSGFELKEHQVRDGSIGYSIRLMRGFGIHRSKPHYKTVYERKYDPELWLNNLKTYSLGGYVSFKFDDMKYDYNIDMAIREFNLELDPTLYPIKKEGKMQKIAMKLFSTLAITSWFDIIYYSLSENMFTYCVVTLIVNLIVYLIVGKFNK